MDIACMALVFGLVALDYATGILKAVIKKNFSSSKMREGLAHKLTYVIAFALCWVLQALSNYLDLGLALDLFPLVTVWCALTETGSIIENICTINPELKSSPLGSLFDDDEKKEG